MSPRKTNKIGPYGQGIGATVQIVEDPNVPSYDASTSTKRDRQIASVIDSPALNTWEQNFLASIYGIERMSGKQTKTFIRCMAKAKSAPDGEKA